MKNNFYLEVFNWFIEISREIFYKIMSLRTFLYFFHHQVKKTYAGLDVKIIVLFDCSLNEGELSASHSDRLYLVIVQ